MSEPALRAGLVTLREGDEMSASDVGPLTRTDFVRYAGAGGDLNPIHHDEEYAKAAGMPTVFGMGMLHAGMLGTRLARWVGPENVLSFGVRFTGQVWPGDVLSFRGVVVGVETGEQGAVARLELGVSSSDGGDVILATATARVAPEGGS